MGRANLLHPCPPSVVTSVVAVHLEGALVHFEVAGDREPGIAVVNRVDHLGELVVMLAPYHESDAVFAGVGGANVDENGHAIGIFRLVCVNHGAGDGAGFADVVTDVVP